jgi:hypothetical protein
LAPVKANDGTRASHAKRAAATADSPAASGPRPLTDTPEPAAQTTGPMLTREAHVLNDESGYHNRRVGSRRRVALRHQIEANVPRGPASLATRLEARGKKTITSTEYESFFASTLTPLAKLLSGQVDDRRWNAKTWAAYQGLCALEEVPAASKALERAFAGAPAASDDAAACKMMFSAIERAKKDLSGTRASSARREAAASLSALMKDLARNTVDGATLYRLVSARRFVRAVSNEVLPSLSAEERESYCGIIHDHGYHRAQAERMAQTDTLLCPVTPSGQVTGSLAPGIAIPETVMISLLAPEARQRYLAKDDPAVAGTERSLPKLTLADFFELGQGPDAEAAARERARRFLATAGKDLEAPNVDLDGVSIERFLARRGGESDPEYHKRLAHKQIWNAFARPWADLKAFANAFADPEAVKKQHAFLAHKQETALACSLALLNWDAVFQRALKYGSGAIAETMDRTMDALWRVTSPGFDFSHPLIERGFGDARSEGIGGEQRAKTRTIWESIVATKKVRHLVGLADRLFEKGFSDVIVRKGPLPEPHEDELSVFMRRLIRDAGVRNPALVAALGGVRLGPDEASALRRIHQLRHEPSLFTLRARSPASIDLGDVVVEVAGKQAESGVHPEFVAATTIGYRAKVVSSKDPALKAGESVILRVPKGAHYAVEDGKLTKEIHDPARYTETSLRLGDQSAIAAEHGFGVPRRKEIRQSGEAIAVLEMRPPGTVDAATDLRSGRRQLQKRDVDLITDIYVRGISEIDEAQGRRFGAFFEVGPENMVFDSHGVTPAYLDVALLYRDQRSREAFGFFTGGYGSAANWIKASATPINPDEVTWILRGDSLSPAERARRDLFFAALEERLDPRHPVYEGMPAERREAVLATLLADLDVIRSRL